MPSNHFATRSDINHSDSWKRSFAVLLIAAVFLISPTATHAVSKPEKLIESRCGEALSSPAVVVRLALLESIPSEQFDDVLAAVEQRVNLLAIDSCSVERGVDDTIIVMLPGEVLYALSMAEIVDFVSRRGYIEIVDPIGVILDIASGGVVATPEAGPSSIASPASPKVLATNDDILDVYVGGLTDGSLGVFVEFSDRSARLIFGFFNDRGGEKLTILLDGKLVLAAEFEGVNEPGVRLMISGLELHAAGTLARYLASDDYPAKLCVSSARGEATPGVESVVNQRDDCEK